MPREAPFPKLERPIYVPLVDTFVVPALLDQEQGRVAIERIVRKGFLRPFDIARARIEEPLALWVPFWRVEVSIDELHLQVSKVNVEVGKESRPVPVPTGAARFRQIPLAICARTAFPYEARFPTILERVSGGPSRAIEIATGDMTSPAEMEMLEENGATVLEADLDRAGAESKALGLLLQTLSPTHAFFSTYEPKIERAAFGLYPVYFARYAYAGEARRQPDEELVVALSGRTGQVMAETHPSVPRAMAAKLRRLLSFDRRV